jgi:hypothetical protein
VSSSSGAAEHRPFFAQIRRRDSDQLPSDLNAVRELVASHGWQLVMDLLDQAHGDAARRLLFAHAGAEGRVLEQAEYARLLGFLSGIGQARVAADALIAYAERVHSQED